MDELERTAKRPRTDTARDGEVGLQEQAGAARESKKELGGAAISENLGAVEKKASQRKFQHCEFKDDQGCECECEVFHHQVGSLKCKGCRHGRGFHVTLDGKPEHGFTECLDRDCSCREYDPGTGGLCDNCMHAMTEHLRTVFWVVCGRRREVFEHGTTSAEVLEYFENAGFNVGSLKTSDGKAIKGPPVVGKTYMLREAAEPQEKRFAREGVHPQVPGAAPEAARFAGEGVHSKGEGPQSPGAGPEAARCGGEGVVNLGEGPQLPGTGQFAGRGGIGAEGDISVGGLKEALRGALVDPVFAGGDVVVVQEESGQKRSFQVGGPPLARSSRGAVYAVKALDTPEGRAAILRHGQWIGEESIFVETHTAALERLGGRLGHHVVICKGVVCQSGEELEAGGKQALAVVESDAGKSLQPGSLDAYGVCQLGANLSSQLWLQQEVGILQRDLSLSNILVQARRFPRPPLPSDPPVRSVSGVAPTESPLPSQGSSQALLLSSSDRTSSNPLSCATSPSSEPASGSSWLGSPSAVLHTPPPPPLTAAHEYEGLSFTNCDFDLAGVRGITERFGFHHVDIPMVRNLLVQPHTLYVDYLTPGDVALTLALVMAIAYGGKRALSWAGEADAGDESGVVAKFQKALADPRELFGLGKVHPLVGQFVYEAKAAVQSDAAWDAWSKNLQRATDELSINRGVACFAPKWSGAKVL